MAKPSKAAQNQLNTTNAAAAGAGANANNIYSALEPQYAQMATNPTASPIYNTDLTASKQSLGGATAGITGQANLQAARTHNDAGYASALDSGARSAQQQQSQIATELPGAIQQQGLSGLGGLGAQQGSLESSLYGLGPSTINAWTGANAQEDPLTKITGLISGAGAKGVTL